MHALVSRLTVLLATSILLGLPALAAGEDQAAASPSGIPSLPGPTLHGKLQLTLHEAVSMGLRNNLDVEVERYQPLIRYQDVGGAWGAFDPETFAEIGYSDTQRPVATPLQSGQDIVSTTRTDGEGGFRGLVPWLGADYQFSFAGSRTSSDSQLQNLSPQLDSSFQISATFPLLKDLVWNEPWTRVKTTRSVYEGSREDFRRQVMDTVRDIEAAYWNLIASDEQGRVARKSLEASQALLEQTKTQYEVGVVSKVEVVEAEAGVAERDVNLIRAENAYRTAQDNLINLVLGRHLTAVSQLEIEPTDRPEDYIVYEIDLGEAVDKAFRNRPELATLQYNVRRLEYNLRFAKNQRLPSFDVQGSYGYDGLAGDPGSSSSTVGRNFGNTFDDYFKQDGGQQWAVRGVFSIPIPNRTARHRVSRSELELRRAETRIAREEQRIILEVRKAARDLQSAQEGIEAAERRRIASSEQLRAENVRLEYGESTPFDVLERERDMVDAESQEIGALQLYRTSVTDLHRAQGTILKRRNIWVHDVSGLR